MFPLFVQNIYLCLVSTPKLTILYSSKVLMTSWGLQLRRPTLLKRQSGDHHVQLSMCFEISSLLQVAITIYIYIIATIYTHTYIYSKYYYLVVFLPNSTSQDSGELNFLHLISQPDSTKLERLLHLKLNLRPTS